MFGRNREHLVEAKAMKLRDFRRLLLRINFVDNKKDWFAGPAQEPDKLLIGRCDAASAIGHEEDEYRCFNCDLRLLEYSNRNLGFLAGDDAAGIDNFVRAAMPIEDAVNAIACNSRLVCYD